MKTSIGVLPAIFPMPVLIVAAYDKDGTIQAMNAAWGTICGMDKVALCIDEDHATTKAIRETGAFTVALADAAHVAEADYLGIATGNKMADKFAKSGLSAQESGHVHAPIIDEFPIVLECELAEIVQTDHLHMVVGTIVNVSTEESVLDDGQVNPAKARPLIFDQFQRGYYVAGEKIAQAWNAGKELMRAAKEA